MKDTLHVEEIDFNNRCEICGVNEDLREVEIHVDGECWYLPTLCEDHFRDFLLMIQKFRGKELFHKGALVL